MKQDIWLRSDRWGKEWGNVLAEASRQEDRDGFVACLETDEVKQLESYLRSWLLAISGKERP